MEEPLLGSRKKPVFQIPEACVAGHDFPVSSPAASLKERLIFGSLEFSPRLQFASVEYAAPSEQSACEEEDQLPISHNEQNVCASCGNAYIGLSDHTDTAAKSFDDSFLDSRRLGSFRTVRSFSPALTRLELESRAADAVPAGSPGAGLPSTLRGIPDCSIEGEKQFHTILVPPEVGSQCHSCLKTRLPRSKTAPAVTFIADKSKLALDLKRPPRLCSPTSVVAQAFMGLVIYLAVGVTIFTWTENDFTGSTTHAFVDALYFCIVTMCTIGYGDITPVTPRAKLFSCAFVLVGFGFIDILLSGMVSYILEHQEMLFLNAVATGHHETAKNYMVDMKKGRMRIRSKVAIAFGVVIMCIGVGTLVMHSLESLGWLDSFYLSCMSVTTVGYGDRAFETMAGRLFACVWLLVSTLAVARSFLYLAEAQIDKRHRLIAKCVLEKEMTIGDLVAADLDNDGTVSKSDFLVYKLKEMGKIDEKDILEICKQFNRLDSDNTGKLRLSCLIKPSENPGSK